MAKTKPNKPKNLSDSQIKASKIVGFALVHFGMGLGAGGTTGSLSRADLATFDDVEALAQFHAKLLTSTLHHFRDIDFDETLTQSNLANAAFQHGLDARAKVPAGGRLTLDIIIDSLRELDPTLCPTGSGGGRVCAFPDLVK